MFAGANCHRETESPEIYSNNNNSRHTPTLAFIKNKNIIKPVDELIRTNHYGRDHYTHDMI